MWSPYDQHPNSIYPGPCGNFKSLSSSLVASSLYPGPRGKLKYTLHSDSCVRLQVFTQVPVVTCYLVSMLSTLVSGSGTFDIHLTQTRIAQFEHNVSPFATVEGVAN